MKTIWKYKLYPHGSSAAVTLEAVPVGAVILHVAVQRGDPCIWMLVDPDSVEKTSRTFLFVATGQPLPSAFLDHNKFVGTVLLCESDRLVLHIFERNE